MKLVFEILSNEMTIITMDTNWFLSSVGSVMFIVLSEGKHSPLVSN